MKISDKALKLIGRIILGSMGGRRNRNDPELTAKNPSPVNTPRLRLNLQPAVKLLKSPVLPFRKMDD